MMNKTQIDSSSEKLPAVDATVFLQTLYGSAPESLFLEFRCIHPETGEVRNFWVESDEAIDLADVLKQTEKLNQEGFGIYYAPCLRREKKGKAIAAALLPALWIDIDCEDEAQREQSRVELLSFDPEPSIIINSGGGWHGYWLLDAPFQLENDDHRPNVARVMRGLFSVLNGDEGYVKSVASLMRLPGSLNTKPERHNAKVEIVHWHPDRRYSMTCFNWLISDTQKHKQDTEERFPLPERTELYLTTGASDGNRNQELFAAACQMRDVGYSQSEAENDLIGRYLADGAPSENQDAREREAKATIASAFSQPPRGPIADKKAYAKQVVSQLVGQYQAESQLEHPKSEEIIEAVEACAHMNSVEWAEQRERFKTLTGNGLKISDIDRLYRDSKKQLEREIRQSYVDTESYVLLDGRIVYRKETYRGILEKTVADWSASALYQTCQVDDDGNEVHVTTVELHRGDSIKKLDVPSDVFVDDMGLRRYIGANAGSQYVVRAGMSKHLAPAIVQLSGEYPTRRHYGFMGWKQIDDRWVYVSPADCVTANGKLAEPLSVELDQRLRDYGLKAIGWRESLGAFDAMAKVLPHDLASALISFALLPILQRFFPATATRPAVHLVGTSGSGKSEIASLLSSFYGEFSRDTPPAQWGDTINTVETLGYPLADAIFWVDDYKSIYADERTFTRFLQAYSRGMGRGRLTREAKVRHEKPCRGLILSTGETTIQGEMSIIARMLVLEIPPWEVRDPQGQALLLAEERRTNLGGFTAHFASWVARELEQGDLKNEIADRFAQNVKGYKAKLTAQVGKNTNTDRVIKNWAVLVTVFQLLSRFLQEMDEDYMLPPWQDALKESIQTLRQERASEMFLDILGQLLAGGQVVLEEDIRSPSDHSSGVTVVGYKDERFVYLLPEIAHREVSRVQPLRFSAHAIGMQLKEDGILIPGSNNLSTQKRIRGGRVRLWQLRPDFFLETVETLETN